MATTIDGLLNKDKHEALHWKRRAQLAERAVDRLMRDRATFSQIAKEIVGAVEAAVPAKLVDSPNKGSNKRVAAVVKASDWQIGEVISAAETDGFGRFCYKTAEQRVARLQRKIIEWVQMHRRAGFAVDELHVFSEADLVSGNIHYELEVTNEFPAPVAAVKAGMLLAAFIEGLAANVAKIHVHEVNHDNHGRFTRKNQAKQGGKNNWSYIAHTIANQNLSKYVADGRIFTHLAESPKLIADVMGKKFLLAHGHHIMGQMGIPFYGMERDKAREAVKRMHQPASKRFHYISIGHWHVPAIISGNILVNGNLPGTTEFDHMQGRHAGPSQVSFMVHPKHGLFDWTAWKL